MPTSSIKKNYIFNLFSQFVTFAIPLVTNPYVSRIFGADGIGIVSYTGANVTYFVLFGMLGISGYGQREIAIYREDRNKTSHIFWELQIIHIITFLVTSAVYIGLIFNSTEYKTFYLIQFITILASFLDINWFYNAYERFQFIAIRNTVIKLIQLCLTFLLIHNKNDLPMYVLITTSGTLFSNIALWTGLKKYIDFVPFKELKLKRHLKDIFIFFIPSIAASIYSILDKSVINWITRDVAENGYYEQANKILIIANVFIQSLSNVSAPRMANLYGHNDIQTFKNNLNKALQFMLFLSIPTAFGVAGIAERFVPLFFGSGFEKVTYILYIFMPMVIVLGFSVYLDGMYLVPAGRRAESARAVCIGAASNFVLNIIFVYFWGSIGAALATLITEIIVSSIMTWLSKDMVNWNMVFNEGRKYLLTAICMFLVVYNCNHLIVNDFWNVAIQVAIGIAIYIGTMFITKDKMLFTMINSALGKLKRKRG